MSDLHVTPTNTPICLLDAKEAFHGLTENEKLYSYHLNVGCWAGALSCLAQTSPESPKFFLLLHKLFAADDVADLEKRCLANGVQQEDWDAFIQFCACFYGNMGNYLSFGDTKFIPRCGSEKIAKIVSLSSKGPELAEDWKNIENDIYDLSDAKKQFGLDGKGISTYYSPDMTTAEIQVVQDFLTSQNMGDQAYNTRLFKTSKDGEVVYQLCIASANRQESAMHVFRDVKIEVKYGDHSPFMGELARAIERASKYVPEENKDRVEMLKHYVNSFNSGNIQDHKDSQRSWVKDKGPPVETNIGFIESYRDPFGVRGEFEGFVAVVNRSQSQKFQSLVDNATKFISMLPWDPAFEKDEFLRPDFTSLDVLCFASSGIPAGINIPNYDDIRQEQGFKNVSLGNVLSAQPPAKPITFLAQEDQALFKEWQGRSFEVQVAIHELLGHGSGKLLKEGSDGALNFDKNKVKHPFTGNSIETFYKPGETWDGKFGAESSSYEECRAESVGIFLSCVPEILSLFGHSASADEVSDVTYVNWLIMVRAGLLSLEYFTPENSKWRQAHMQARYAILRVLLEAGEGLVSIVKKDDDVIISLDRSKILSVGRKAMAAFLEKLNVYKATADVEEGIKMYKYYTSVPEDMLELRKIVLAKKEPRKIFVQGVTSLSSDGQVSFKDYEATAYGMINSFKERYSADGPLGSLVEQLKFCGQFPMESN
uniref:Dipeptidyl peptidase 3 n=1 Tax=Guillardia theta TaxID=55529 RepID=A0A7S4NQS1_GUITH|mmetsp:Transcript_29366/g.94259  ORF Transcript_29366/g.94259 Transcript_29366/m.94259 type:complete len:709 (+) Transcript_29366:36-2162(+)